MSANAIVLARAQKPRIAAVNAQAPKRDPRMEPRRGIAPAADGMQALAATAIAAAAACAHTAAVAAAAFGPVAVGVAAAVAAVAVAAAAGAPISG
jgi:hypothetical protein